MSAYLHVVTSEPQPCVLVHSLIKKIMLGKFKTREVKYQLKKNHQTDEH